jgi:Ni,Fe-hydrogenase I cytochrome b subunit
MATDNHDHSHFDMRTHEETWANFGRLAKWIVILTIVLVIGMGLFLTGGHPPKPL